MRKIFITAAGGDVGGSILRCLKEEFPCDIFWGCDIKPEIPFETLLERYTVVPRSNTVQYLDMIMGICRDNSITHFCPTTEAEIVLWDRYRDFFKEHRIALLINNPEIIRIATSKFETSAFLNAHHLMSPKTYRINSYRNQLSFPVIVKPDYGRGSHGVCIVNSQESLEKIRETASEKLVVQQYIGTQEEEYTVGVFSDGVQTRSIAYQRTLGFGGMSVRVETVRDEALDGIAEQVAEIFALEGSINLQLRKDNGKYYIFEINPRLSSTVRFRHKMGFKDAVWWLEVLDGKRHAFDFGIKEGVIGLRYVDEMILAR